MAERNVKTYKETAEEYLASQKMNDPDEHDYVRAFARYLDSFQHITVELHLAAVLKMKEIQDEIIIALANKLGSESRTVITEIMLKHKHKEKRIDYETKNG